MPVNSNRLLSDEDLMVRYRDGNDDAFEMLYRKYEKPLFSFIYRILLSTKDAEDLCQETFLRVVKQKMKYRVSGKFKTWIYQIALNLCRDRLRRRKLRIHRSIDDYLTSHEINKNDSENSSSDPAPDQIDSIEKNELRILIQGALAKLPEKQRTVIILKEYNALKFSEISDIMKSPVGTIKSLNHRGREKLKLILSNYIE
jgi:RNA polymerase sigma-70 factor (ECF subfamily)